MNERDIELAKQAGWDYAINDEGFEPLWRFAELIRADERDIWARDADWCIQNHLEHLIPERIRARGNK